MRKPQKRKNVIIVDNVPYRVKFENVTRAYVTPLNRELETTAFFVATGQVTYNPGDTFNLNTGKKLALAQALKDGIHPERGDLFKDWRRKFWAAVFKKGLVNF